VAAALKALVETAGSRARQALEAAAAVHRAHFERARTVRAAPTPPQPFRAFRPEYKLLIEWKTERAAFSECFFRMTFDLKGRRVGFAGSPFAARAEHVKPGCDGEQCRPDRRRLQPVQGRLVVPAPNDGRSHGAALSAASRQRASLDVEPP